MKKILNFFGLVLFLLLFSCVSNTVFADGGCDAINSTTKIFNESSQQVNLAACQSFRQTLGTAQFYMDCVASAADGTPDAIIIARCNASTPSTISSSSSSCSMNYRNDRNTCMSMAGSNGSLVNYCGVMYATNMNSCHSSQYSPGTCYDVPSCQSSCNDIVAAATAAAAAGGNYSIIIGFYNASICQSACSSDVGTNCVNGNNPIPANTLNLSGGPDIEKMYGYHQEGFGDDGFRDCAEDGDGAGGKCVAINGSPARGGHGCPMGPTFQGLGGNMTCWYRDAETPDNISANPSSNRRQNTPVNLTLSIKDVGGSGIGNTGRWTAYENGFIKYIWSYNGSDCFNGGTQLFPVPGMGQGNYNLQLNVEGSHYLYVCAKDNSGNLRTYSFGPYRYDATLPVATIMNMTLKDQQSTKNILANNDGSNFKILYDEGDRNLAGCSVGPGMADYSSTSCAGLPGITYDYEDVNNNNVMIQNTTTCNGTNCNKTLTWDVSKVDNDDDSSDGKRVYDSHILNICDDAGNCQNKPYNWNLFANVPDWGGTNTSYSNNFSSTVVGDGDAHLISTAKIRDRFGNKVIPVSDIGRTVNFNMSYSNTTYLNQYDMNGGAGLFFNLEGQGKYVQSDISTSLKTYSQFCRMPTDATCDNVTQITHGTGIYNLNLVSFVPNKLGYVQSDGATLFNQFDSHIYDTGTVDWPAGGLNDTHIFFNNGYNLKFLPLFYTQIQSNPLVSEGIGKQFSVQFSENTAGKFNSSSISNIEYLLKYNADPTKIYPYLTGGSSINVNDSLKSGDWYDLCLRGQKTHDSSFSNFSDCNAASKIMNDGVVLGSNLFGAGYVLNSGAGSTFDGQSVGSISTHFATKFARTDVYGYPGGVTSIWNSDIVGATSYQNKSTQVVLENQNPIKIIGVTASSDFDRKTSMVLSGSYDKMDKGGKMDKYKLESIVHKNVSQLVRNIHPLSAGVDIFTDSNYANYNGFKIFYAKLSNGDNFVVNGKIGNNDKIILIVEGGNVVFNGDIQQGSDGVLGVVSLNGGQATDGGAGNVYVNKDVTNLESFIYADGGIITFDYLKFGNTINKTQENLGADILRNQLYIKGLLRVNNTVGGSRGSQAKCPYFISSCNFTKAQKYDLEYVRRFHLVKGEQINADLTRSVIYGWTPYSGGLLAGKILCAPNASNVIQCSDQDNGLTNIIDSDVLSTSNPFGGIPDTTVTQKYITNLGPLIIEYDSKAKKFGIPIFNIDNGS